jgi:hypothetical protein
MPNPIAETPAGSSLKKRLPHSIVEVQHRRTQASASAEQAGLGREVRVHVTVVVEVIAGEIGEHRHVEGDGIHPP